ncbi:MAG: ECF-type sigma factor [Lysobacterales bacterium]
MPAGKSQPITELLGRWRGGDEAAGAALVQEVYPVLQKLAAAQMNRHNSRGTLRATEVVNEAYLRLQQQDKVDWRSRGHFFALAATMMRRVLVDHLRERGRDKRGGGIRFIQPDEMLEEDHDLSGDPIDWLAIDQALVELERSLPAVAKIVELRLFGGLDVGEIAEATGTSPATVGRHWRFAKAWLAEKLEIDIDHVVD